MDEATASTSKGGRVMSKPEMPMKSGFWQDCFTGWHKLLCYVARPGVRKKAKREYHKAFRRGTRKSIWIKSLRDENDC